MNRIVLLLACTLSLVSCKKEREMSVSVTTAPATDITVSSAQLNGSYFLASHSVREVGFEWGETEGSLTHVVQADMAVTFKATISNLGDNKTYYYRAYTVLQDGSQIKTFYGTVVSFNTVKEAEPTPPEPTVEGNQPGWPELPVMQIKTNEKGFKVNQEDANMYYAWHICPDVNGPGDKKARNYTVCYSGTDHVAYWIAAPRHPMYSKANTTRTDAYTWDPDIPKEVQYVKEGANAGLSGYNRGHLLGSAERRVSVATNQQVFYHTNIAPQLSSGFNTGGGGWNIMEDFIGKFECPDTMYVVIGTYFKDYTDGYGKKATAQKATYAQTDKVSLPTMFYYAVLRTKAGNSGKSVKDCKADELMCAAFVRAHTNDLKNVQVSTKDMMSVEDLEKITGFKYFPNVPNAPTGSFNAADWGL